MICDKNNLKLDLRECFNRKESKLVKENSFNKGF